MNALLILLIGIVVVVGSVLVLKLHALLALILGAVVVVILTPTNNVFRSSARPAAFTIQSIDSATGIVTIINHNRLKEKLSTGAELVCLSNSELNQIGFLKVETANKDTIVATARLIKGNLPEPNAIVIEKSKEPSFWKSARTAAGERLGEAFGKTAGNVGILIMMAAIIGQCLLESGAAEGIIIAIRRVLGDKRTPLAFSLSGFLLTIPCFFETVFYLMIPLGKMMRARTGKDYTLYVMSIIAGGTMAHSLVPPTPGPTFTATEFNISFPAMMLGGALVGLPAAMVGLLYAHFANRRWDIPLREEIVVAADGNTGVENPTNDRQLPNLFLSFIPVLLPIILICIATVLETSIANGERTGQPSGLAVWSKTSPIASCLKLIGNRNIALILTAVLALLLVWKTKSAKQARLSVQHALNGSAVMVLIIAAGGAFGGALQQTDIADQLKTLVPTARFSLIPLAFLLTTLIRTAQGSATVAMITASGIIAPIAAVGGLGFHPIYLALAIGCGSKPIMWMNDSGFWVISKMSGMTEGETFKTASVMMLIMALTGLVVVMAGAILMPMV